jgi:hypothetical protein
MKTKTLLFILIVAFLIPVNTQAQVGNLLKKKLEQAVTSVKKNTEQETAKEVEGNIEEKAAQQDSTQPGKPSKFNMPGLGMGKVTAKYEENYDFKGLIKMKTEIYDKGKTSGVMDIETWFNVSTGSVGMESSTVESENGEKVSATAIVDTKNKVMITYAVMNGAKSGMIMLLPDSASNTQTASGQEPQDVKVRKTGNTRTICGYHCDEYEVLEDKDNVRSLVWTTQEVNFKGNTKMLESQKGMPKNYGQLKGVMMASETYEKGTLSSKMEVTKIDMDATHTISTKDASLIQMDMSKWGQKKK